MDPDERIRLFCALRLPDEAIGALVPWQRRELHGGRLVPPENLHITLAFLGGRPADELPAIGAALRTAAEDAGELQLRVGDYRETRSVGMLTFDDEGQRATALAESLQELLEELGVYRREQRPWLPHLTVLRFRKRPRLSPPLPDLGGSGEITPSDAAVYMSKVRPGGVQHQVLEVASLCE